MPKQDGVSKQYIEWMEENKGHPTWRSMIKDDVDEYISYAVTFNEFIMFMEHNGYRINEQCKYITVQCRGMKRCVRLKSIGENYTREALQIRIDAHAYEYPTIDKKKYKPKFIPKPPKGAGWLLWTIWYRDVQSEIKKSKQRPPRALRDIDILAHKNLSRMDFINRYKIDNVEDYNKVKINLENQVGNMVAECNDIRKSKEMIIDTLKIDLQHARKDLIIANDIPDLMDRLERKLQKMYPQQFRKKSKQRNSRQR